MTHGEFYAWVEQAARENEGEKADDPHSWRGTDHDEWWQEVRRKKEERKAERLRGAR
jgi:hypothetical protein